MSILALNKVNYSYKNGKKVLNDISMEFEKGKFYAILGVSGSGKTTLLSLLAGLDEPRNGEILYNNQNRKVKGYENHRKSNISLIFQNYNLLNSLTIYENIMIPLKLIGEDKKVIDEKVHQITKELDIESLLNKYPHECSGGQQQRVAIARALIGNPKIIIADEPTGNLDSQNSHEILSIFKKMNENHITIIMVSHDPLIASYSSRLLYLKDGKIEKELFKGDKTQQEYFKEIVSINSKEMQKMLD